MDDCSGIPEEMIVEANRLALRGRQGMGEVPSALEGLTIFRAPRTTAFEDALYQTVACLVLQGAKEIIHGDHQFSATAGTLVLVSHDLPVLSRITEASTARPYLALVHVLDMAELRDLAGEPDMLAARPESSSEQSLGVLKADAVLVDAYRRLIDALGSPQTRTVLAPLIRREIAFRLLTRPEGDRLWKLTQGDSKAGRIARAIALIRADLRQPASVSHLADAAGMSPSVFHDSFKKVTALTPLQYGKTLRLTRAKELLAHERRSVAETAFEVGYESPTQFSRDFSRRFGVPPSSLLGHATG